MAEMTMLQFAARHDEGGSGSVTAMVRVAPTQGATGALLIEAWIKTKLPGHGGAL